MLSNFVKSMDSSAITDCRSLVIMWGAGLLKWMKTVCDVERVKMKDSPLPPHAVLRFNILCSVQLLFASTCDVAGIPQWRRTGAERTQDRK